VSENRELRRIFGSKIKEVTEIWTKLKITRSFVHTYIFITFHGSIS
jgi:hypothetical protein